MPTTSTDVATSCQLTRIGIEKYLDRDILHKQNIWSDLVNGRADSGGHGPPEESLHGSVRKTDEDREPDYNQLPGIMPSSHPRTSESDCSLSDDFPTQPCTTRTWSLDPVSGSNKGSGTSESTMVAFPLPAVVPSTTAKQPIPVNTGVAMSRPTKKDWID